MRAALTIAAVLSFVLYFALLSLPVGHDAQVVLGLAGLVMMIIIDRLGAKHAGRTVFVLIGLALVVRYMVWRATSTLPPTNEVLNFSASLMVFGAELFCFVTMLLGLFAVARPIDRTPLRAFRPTPPRMSTSSSRATTRTSRSSPPRSLPPSPCATRTAS